MQTVKSFVELEYLVFLTFMSETRWLLDEHFFL
jgi:hypothetical protein